MWRSLVWKEWHEQRWRLGFGVFLVGTFTLIGLRTRIVPDEAIVALTIMVGGMLFPLMVAMGLVAPERADGTIVRLLALPVPAWQVLAAKAVVGTAVCAGPIVVSGVLAAVVAGDRELSWRELASMYGMASGVSIATFTWLTAASVRQPSEARAGLVGVGVFIAWFLAIALSTTMRTGAHLEIRLDEWIAYASPFGLVALRNETSRAALVVVIQLVIIALLWLSAARRIGKPQKAGA